LGEIPLTYRSAIVENNFIELQALITERDGMVAENKVRESLGQSMAYHYDNFAILCDQIRALKTVELGTTPNTQFKPCQVCGGSGVSVVWNFCPECGSRFSL
jgi:hypothetical protein